MPFWVYHCKRKLDHKAEHQVSIKTLKLQKIILNFSVGKYLQTTFEQIFFLASLPLISCRWLYCWLKTGCAYAKYRR